MNTDTEHLAKRERLAVSVVLSLLVIASLIAAFVLSERKAARDGAGGSVSALTRPATLG